MPPATMETDQTPDLPVPSPGTSSTEHPAPRTMRNAGLLLAPPSLRRPVTSQDAALARLVKVVRVQLTMNTEHLVQVTGLWLYTLSGISRFPKTARKS